MGRETHLWKIEWQD